MPKFLYPPEAEAPTKSGNTTGGWAADEFYVSSGSGPVASLGWYRLETGTPGPSSIRLRDVDGSSDVLSLTPVDSGAVGWQWTNLTTPVSLTPSHMYAVGAVEPSGMAVGGHVAAITPDTPFAFERGVYGSTWYADVSTFTGRGIFSVSDTNLDTGGGGPPAGEGDPTTTGDLASWLSSLGATNTHQVDGLPWLTKAQVDLTQTYVTALRDVVGALSDAASATGSVLARTAEILARIPADILTSISDLVDLIGSWFGATARPEGAPTIPEQLSSTFDQLLALRDQVTELEGHVLQLQAPLAGFPTDFELASEFDFIDCVSWPVPADVYVLHLTTLPRGRAFSPVCGVNLCTRAGWWAPLADTLPGERRYIDFEFTLLTSAGGRTPGVLIQFQQDGAATIQAWNRLPPPIGPLPVPPIP